jgi:aldose 1-epimerase
MHGAGIRLTTADVAVTIHPEHGGRIGQITVAGVDLLIDDRTPGPIHWGCYPMVPWAGRVGVGRFEFDGIAVQLPINDPPHALHGTVFDAPWEVEHAHRLGVQMRCDLGWPLGGWCEQRITLTPNALHCQLSVTAGDTALPVVVGWHPWFRGPARLDVEFASMYLRGDDRLPTGERVVPPPPPWDDCFTGAVSPPALTIDGVRVIVDSSCDHWVIYTPEHAVCLEPQSGPPNAFNLGGALRLDPGESQTWTMVIGWQRIADESPTTF